MKSFGQLHEETNALHYDFLMLEIKTAGTFLDVVQTTQNEETRSRSLQNATKAYATVVRLRPRVIMTEQQTTEMDTELASLRTRIEQLDTPGTPEEGAFED